MNQERSRAEPEALMAAIAEIRAYHREGRFCLANTPKSGNYGKGFIVERCEQLGPSWNPTKLRKARQFAAEYAPNDLRKLVDLLKRYRPVFGITHVGILLTVSKVRVRTKLQRWCIDCNRSTAELEAEIKKRYGVRRQGGRRRAVGLDIDHVLVQLEGMCDTWRRWYLVVAPEQLPEGTQSILEQLPRKVQEGIGQVNRTTQRLAATVDGELQARRRQLALSGSV
jgi:hypothetical protein